MTGAFAPGERGVGMSLLASPGGIVAVFPGGGVGLFGPTGFTRRPAVATLLAPYEVDDPDGDVVTFDGLPRRTAAALLGVLPTNQGEVGTGDAPSFRELLDLTLRCPSARFRGYRASPRRFDERIALDGFVVRRKEMTAAVRARVDLLGPCEVTDDGRTVTVRWG